MKDWIGIGILLLVLAVPVSLIVLLVKMVRKRRRREAQGLSTIPKHSYRNMVDPFSLRGNWLTCFILLLLCIGYVYELACAIEGPGKWTPTLGTLMATGGVSRSTVEHGGWYRIFTAPFLHGSITHLLLNCLALFFAGRILERQLGRAWFLAVYFISAWAGSLMSISINTEHLLSVGASGAIMGMFAAIMAVSFHASNREIKRGLQIFSLRIIIPSILPTVSHEGGTHVDYGAHFGGLIGGFLCTLLMMIRWPTDSAPRLRGLAVAINTFGILLTCYSFGLMSHHYYEYKVLGNCVAPMREEAVKSHVDVAKYIQDNGAYLERCIKYYTANRPH